MTPTSPENDPLRRVILLRHGRTAWNEQGRWQGRLDVPIDDVGLRQAERAAALLVRDGSITRLVTSPARRAAQTTSVLKGAFDLAGRPLVRTDDARLVEIDMGAWAGLTHAEVAARWPDASAAIARGDDVRRGDDGETLAEATARVEAGVRDAVSLATPGESVLVVTHGAVIRGVAGALAGLTPQTVRTSFRSIDNCHWVTLVERRDGGWAIERWNAGE